MKLCPRCSERPRYHPRRPYCRPCTNEYERVRQGRTPSQVTIPTEPLRAIARLHGNIKELGLTQVLRYKHIGVAAADRAAVALGYHPYEIWGEDFYQGCANHTDVTTSPERGCAAPGDENPQNPEPAAC